MTPPLDGLILPGVTRQSLLELARNWGEFEVREASLPMSSVLGALREGRLREMFGAGTACVVCPVGGILYQDELHPVPTMENGPKVASRFLQELSDIQYGRVPSPWAQPV